MMFAFKHWKEGMQEDHQQVMVAISSEHAHRSNEHGSTLLQIAHIMRPHTPASSAGVPQ